MNISTKYPTVEHECKSVTNKRSDAIPFDEGAVWDELYWDLYCVLWDSLWFLFKEKRRMNHWVWECFTILDTKALVPYIWTTAYWSNTKLIDCFKKNLSVLIQWRAESLLHNSWHCSRKRQQKELRVDQHHWVWTITMNHYLKDSFQKWTLVC